jgi:uncharacterized protein YukJ
MGIQNYSVLKGDAVAGSIVQGRSPHYQIQVKTDEGATITVAVNIQSVDGSEVLYLVDHAFVPADPAAYAALPTGLTALQSQPGGLAIDFVRSRINGQPLVTKAQMSLLPTTEPAGSRNNDLNNEIVDLLNRVVADPGGTIFAFGSSYADPGGVQGIHDIHMNQGNPVGNFANDNGVWQDGALFVSLPATSTWIAVYIAFQTESWNTDNTIGDPI